MRISEKFEPDDIPHSELCGRDARARLRTVALFGVAAVGAFLLLRYLTSEPMEPMIGHTWTPLPEYPEVMAFQGQS